MTMVPLANRVRIDPPWRSDTRRQHPSTGSIVCANRSPGGTAPEGPECRKPGAGSARVAGAGGRCSAPGQPAGRPRRNAPPPIRPSCMHHTRAAAAAATVAQAKALSSRIRRRRCSSRAAGPSSCHRGSRRWRRTSDGTGTPPTRSVGAGCLAVEGDLRAMTLAQRRAAASLSAAIRYRAMTAARRVRSCSRAAQPAAQENVTAASDTGSTPRARSATRANSPQPGPASLPRVPRAAATG